MNWSEWKPASCVPDCWCEAVRDESWILEPVNTWTNLTFIIAGLFFFFFSGRLQCSENLLGQDKLYSRTYGGALVFLGLGSFFFHASRTLAGQWFDVFGMFLVSGFFIIYNLRRLNGLKSVSFFSSYMRLSLFLGLVIFFFPATRRWLFGLSLVVIVFQAYYLRFRQNSKMNGNWLVASIITYALAQTLWVLDKSRIWCQPYALMNGHGLWHILTGVTAVLIYFYHLSERKLDLSITLDTSSRE